jgi:hypothetical protein
MYGGSRNIMKHQIQNVVLNKYLGGGSTDPPATLAGQLPQAKISALKNMQPLLRGLEKNSFLRNEEAKQQQ